jgi:hypothetical protein
MGYNTVILSPEASVIRNEGLADAAGILPGHMLEETATGVAVQSTADAVTESILLADISISDAGDISRVYASGEIVHYCAPQKGAEVVLILSTSQTIAKGAELAATGDGTVKAPAVAGVGVLFTAIEAVTTTAATAFIRAKVR